MIHNFLLAALFLSAAVPAPSQVEVQRQDFFVDGDPGVRLFVREVRLGNDRPSGRPILLLHGARVPGLASFDLPVPGGSLAADLAQLGFDIYAMDIRGYGSSTRPREMDQPPGSHAPLVRSNEAVRDISAVVDSIRRRRHVARVAILGWATGGQWGGYYASLYPENVSALILLNSLYRGSSQHRFIGHGTDSEDPAQPYHFNQHTCGGYRLNDANSLLGAWDRSIPMDDKSEWRDPAVAKAYVQAALNSDSTSHSRTPPSFRSPCGALEDSFYLAIGRQLWDVSLVTAPILILASERDFWSRPEDRQALAQAATHSPHVKTVV